ATSSSSSSSFFFLGKQLHPLFSIFSLSSSFSSCLLYFWLLFRLLYVWLLFE
ncbi:unnamed protein product, partial [Prunus brigantina]